MYAHIRNTKIYFDIDGVGDEIVDGKLKHRPTIFLLHGGPGANHRGYKSQLGELTDTAQLIYVDHRGNGESCREHPETWSMESHVEDIEALRQHLGLEKIAMHGGSYGGMVAMNYGAKYSQHLSALSLAVTAPSYRFMDKAKTYLAEHATPEQLRICEKLWQGSFKSDDEIREYYRLLGPMYGKTFDVKKFEENWQPGLYNYEALNVAFAGYLREFDVTEQLGNITCPTLVLGAAGDWICPPEFSHEIARCIPHADLKIFDDCGHSIGSDQKQLQLTALRSFFAAVTQNQI